MWIGGTRGALATLGGVTGDEDVQASRMLGVTSEGMDLGAGSAPTVTSRLTRIAAGSASVWGSTARTNSPASPWKLRGASGAGHLLLRNKRGRRRKVAVYGTSFASFASFAMVDASVVGLADASRARTSSAVRSTTKSAASPLSGASSHSTQATTAMSRRGLRRSAACASDRARRCQARAGQRARQVSQHGRARGAAGAGHGAHGGDAEPLECESGLLALDDHDDLRISDAVDAEERQLLGGRAVSPTVPSGLEPDDVLAAIGSIDALVDGGQRPIAGADLVEGGGHHQARSG